MTLSLDLVNKCSLSSSCVPSTRITHNPGTHVDHNEAGRQKCELHHSVKSALTREGESAICGQCGVEGWHYLFLGGQGRAGRLYEGST